MLNLDIETIDRLPLIDMDDSMALCVNGVQAATSNETESVKSEAKVEGELQSDVYDDMHYWQTGKVRMGPANPLASYSYWCGSGLLAMSMQAEAERFYKKKS